MLRLALLEESSVVVIRKMFPNVSLGVIEGVARARIAGFTDPDTTGRMRACLGE